MTTLKPPRKAQSTSPRPPAQEGRSASRRTLLHFIASIDGGGAEAMLRSLAAGIDKDRWRVVVVAVDARPWPEARTFLEEHCDAFHDLESDKFLNRATLSGLRRILHQEQPDLVQTWMHHADLVGGVAAWLSGVPKVIWSIHCREIHRSPGESRVKAGLIGPALSATSRWVPAAIVSCSQAAIEDHRRRGYPASRMRWIANGIDASRFCPNDKARSRLRNELTIPEDAPVVGFVGRFHEMKDPATLFHAIHRMQAKQPDVHFLLCGGGAEELDEATHQTWRRLRAIEKVHFLPFRPDPENLYPAMDLFTLTSRTEACPMTLLEAMACGVPCVASDTGDCRLLIDGLGEMVEPGDGAGFQQAWSRTLNWTLEKPELGNQVREHVHQNFSIEGCIRAYESLYNELVPASKS